MDVHGMDGLKQTGSPVFAKKKSYQVTGILLFD